MKNLTVTAAIQLLKKYSANDADYKIVLAHSKAVSKVAKDIAKDIKGVDINFIETAALLHDIGRFKLSSGRKDTIRHGIYGASILRKEGLPEAYALVNERHIGAGISKKDIIKQKLNLPLNDFVPISKEEKIICHADNLVFGDKIGTIDDVIKRYKSELGVKIAKKFKKLADEVENMKNT
jgi:uncharacterized protein